MNTAPIKITRQANLLRVSPACEAILGPVLQYGHRTMLVKPEVSVDATGNKRVRYVQITNRKVYSIENGDLYALAGLQDRVCRALSQSRVPFEFEDLRTLPPELENPDYDTLFRSLNTMVPSGKFEDFRSGQLEVLSLMVGHDNGIFVAPTGWGKSFIVRALSLLYPKANIVIAVPGKALRNSMYEDLAKQTPDVGRVGGGINKPNRITVATPQSILKAQVDACHILIHDECHVCGASSDEGSDTVSLSEVLASIRKPHKWFGFTATPTGRSDGAGMVIEALFGPQLFTTTYQAAQAENAVAPIRVVIRNLEAQEVTTAARECDSLLIKASKKRHAYWRNGARNSLLATAITDTAGMFNLGDDPQVLILTETLEHAIHLKQHLPDYTLIYGTQDRKTFEEYITQDYLPPDYEKLSDKQRDELRAKFESGELRKVIATKVWGTGVNFVNLNILVYASGEPGEIPVVQWGGRVSRTNQEKEFGIIIDCNDRFSDWALKRANMRIRQYKKMGWTVVRPELKDAGNYKQARLVGFE